MDLSHVGVTIWTLQGFLKFPLLLPLLPGDGNDRSFLNSMYLLYGNNFLLNVDVLDLSWVPHFVSEISILVHASLSGLFSIKNNILALLIY